MNSKFKKKLSRALYPPFPYQAYCDKYKLIFIHVPKCAGTSIVTQLSGKQDGRIHAEIHHYLAASRRRYEDYFKFGFVRNPIDRLYSAYNYMRAGGNKGVLDGEVNKRLFTGEMSLNTFIQEYLTKDFSYSLTHFKPQWSFLESNAGTIKVDQIYRVEEMSEAINDLNERLPSLGLVNTVNNKSTSEVEEELTQESLNVILEVYEQDFQKYYPEDLNNRC